MKQITNRFAFRTFLTFCVVAFFQAISWAQDTRVEINGNDVGSWFSRNWLWVTGAVVLLVILLLFSGGGSSRKTQSKTTIYRRGDGTVTKTTTTESDVDG